MTGAADKDRHVQDFFLRNGLPTTTRSLCHDYVGTRYPGLPVVNAQPQGFCSYTLLVGDDLVVQFRPPTHQLDITLTQDACRVYGDLAPETQLLGEVFAGVGLAQDQNTFLQKDASAGIPATARSTCDNLCVYSMSRLPGTSLADFREAQSGGALSYPSKYANDYRRDVISDFACLSHRGWQQSVAGDSGCLASLKGKVGMSLRWRLRLLQSGLPSRFQAHIAAAMSSLNRIEALPWVLTHGDFIPSNIMVRLAGETTQPQQTRGQSLPSTLRICGLLDWAEAEYLPFGVGLYGLEELLGESVLEGGQNKGDRYPAPNSRFEYYDNCQELRHSFWQDLEACIPQLKSDRHFRETVEQARVLGLLLWHGIAFDDGKLDRAVQPGKDDEELQRLDLFLLENSSSETRVGPIQPSMRIWVLVKNAFSHLRRLLFR